MGRGNTDLTSTEYDAFLAEKAKRSRTAMQELLQRRFERRNANDSYRGWHFGIADYPVWAESKEHYQDILTKLGLIFAGDVERDLRGPRKAEFKKRKRDDDERKHFRRFR
jgi:hypothetical protein